MVTEQAEIGAGKGSRLLRKMAEDLSMDLATALEARLVEDRLARRLFYGYRWMLETLASLDGGFGSGPALVQHDRMLREALCVGAKARECLEVDGGVLELVAEATGGAHAADGDAG